MEAKHNYNLGRGKLYITDNFGFTYITNCDEFKIEFITTKKLKIIKTKTKKKPKITFTFNLEPFPVKL